ncbi:MAG: TIM barrel protein [Oscillospiraceae bacterium]|nr:TIM barrel protein [Oscillospiraceae bacterium]
MKLAFSNIGWTAEYDETVLPMLRALGFSGLEVAPTRVFAQSPYSHLQQAALWAKGLRETYGMTVCSMQSIWFGRTENIFGSDAERQALLEYTEKAFAFAQSTGCKSLVFGCPRNRNMPSGIDDPRPAEEFFAEAGRRAVRYGCVLALEANPPMYNTNYLNATASVLALAEKLACDGIRVNLDVGAMLANQEPPALLKGRCALISHVHISEPGLAPLSPHPLHGALAALLREERYEGFVSAEMKVQPPETVKQAALCLREVFG